MKQGVSPTDLYQEVQRQAALKKDFKVQTQALELQGASNLAIKGQPEPFQVSDHMHSQIAARLDIPAKFYQRLRKEQPDMLDYNVNQLFQRKSETRMVRLMGNRARAFLSDRYMRRDHIDLMNYVLPDLLNAQKELGLEIASCQITERKLYIKFVTPKLRGDVRPGDPIEAGGIISNSEIGEGYLEVYPFVKRLICMNGAIIEEYGQRRAHVGKRVSIEEEALELYSDETLMADDHAYWLKIRDSIRTVLQPDRFQILLNKMQHAAQAPITRPVNLVVEELAQRHAFNQDEQDQILRNLVEGGIGFTQWGLANAVTQVANDTPDYDHATELERIGGTIIQLPASEWRAIAA